jgi:hypothetical protein
MTEVLDSETDGVQTATVDCSTIDGVVGSDHAFGLVHYVIRYVLGGDRLPDGPGIQGFVRQKGRVNASSSA